MHTRKEQTLRVISEEADFTQLPWPGLDVGWLGYLAVDNPVGLGGLIWDSLSAPSLFYEVFHLPTVEPRPFYTWAQDPKKQQEWGKLSVHVLFKPLLVVYLLLFYWSKKRPNPISRVSETDFLSWWVKWQSNTKKRHNSDHSSQRRLSTLLASA